MAEEYVMSQARAEFLQAMDQLQSGTYKGSGDIIDWSLWDRFSVDGTTPTLQHRLFVNGRGQPDPAGVIKTHATTNMVGRVGIPTGSKLLVQYLKIFLCHDGALPEADWINTYKMLRETVATIKIFGKDSYGEWGLDELFNHPISGILSPADAADNAAFPTVGRALGVYPLQLPIVLASQVSFEVVVEHHVAPSANLDDTTIKIALCGVLGRLS